eukprot:gene9361-11495_t
MFIKKKKEDLSKLSSASTTTSSSTNNTPGVTSPLSPASPNFVARKCPYQKYGCSSFVVSKHEFDNHLKDDAQLHLQLVVEKFDQQFEMHTQLMAHFTEQMEDQLERTMKVVRNHMDSFGTTFQSKIDEGVEKCMTFSKKVEQQQQQLAKRLITQQIQEKKVSSPVVKGNGTDEDGANINGGGVSIKQLESELVNLQTKLKKEITDFSQDFNQRLIRVDQSAKLDRMDIELRQKIDKKDLVTSIDDTLFKKMDALSTSVETMVFKKIEDKERRTTDQLQLSIDSKVDGLKDKIKSIESQQLDIVSDIRKIKLSSSSPPIVSQQLQAPSSPSFNKTEVLDEIKKLEEKLNKKIQEEQSSNRSDYTDLQKKLKSHRDDLTDLEKDCKQQFDKQTKQIKQVEEDLKKSDSLLMLMQNSLKKHTEFVEKERERESDRLKMVETIKRLEQNQKKIEAEIAEGNEQVERVLREEAALSPINSVPKSPMVTSKRSSVALSSPPNSSPKSTVNNNDVTNLDGETGILWEYDPTINKWIRLTIKLKMERKPFAEGALREAYHTISLGVSTDESQPLGSKHSFPPIESISPLSRNNEAMSQLKSGTKFVLKLYKKEAEQQTSRELYFEDVKMQMVCRDWGHKFNQNKPPKKIEFLMSWVVELVERPTNGVPLLCSIEPLLVGEFKKNNSNYGAVLNNRSTPQAFSHFTYENSNKQMIIVDIQGVDDLYTDPQVHTADGKGYGLGNLGRTGINKFINSHKCNAVCALLNLDVKLGGSLLSSKKQLQGTMIMPEIATDLAPSSNTVKVGAKELPKSDLARKELKCSSKIDSFRERANCMTFYGNDQKYLCVGYGDGTLRIFDLSDNLKCIQTVNAHRKSIGSIWSNSNYIFTSSVDQSIKVHTLNGSHHRLVETLMGHGGEVTCIVSNERHLFSCSYDKTIKVWDLNTFKEVKSLDGVHTKYIKSLCLSGRYLFSGGNDQIIYVWDTETLTCLFNMQGHEDWVLGLHCSGCYLFSSSKDNVIKIWDLNDFHCIDTLKGHWNSVPACVVKDRYLYSGSEDNSIKVWDLDTLECVHTIVKSHALGVNSLLFYKNQLISAAFDGSIKFNDPSQQLRVVGISTEIIHNYDLHTLIESKKNFTPWQGNNDKLIDNYDARAHLDYIKPFTLKKNQIWSITDEEPIENDLNYQRYKGIIDSIRLNIGENDLIKNVGDEMDKKILFNPFKKKSKLEEQEENDEKEMIEREKESYNNDQKEDQQPLDEFQYEYDINEIDKLDQQQKQQKVSPPPPPPPPSSSPPPPPPPPPPPKIEDTLDINLEDYSEEQEKCLNKIGKKFNIKGYFKLALAEQRKIQQLSEKQQLENEKHSSQNKRRKERRNRDLVNHINIAYSNYNGDEENYNYDRRGSPTYEDYDGSPIRRSRSRSPIKRTLSKTTSTTSPPVQDKSVQQPPAKLTPIEMLKLKTRMQFSQKIQQDQIQDEKKKSSNIIDPPPPPSKLSQPSNLFTTTNNLKNNTEPINQPKILDNENSQNQMSTTKENKQLDKNESRSRSKSRDKYRKSSRSRSRSRSRNNYSNSKYRDSSRSRDRYNNRRSRSRSRSRDRYNNKRSRSRSKSRDRYRDNNRSRNSYYKRSRSRSRDDRYNNNKRSRSRSRSRGSYNNKISRSSSRSRDRYRDKSSSSHYQESRYKKRDR